MGWLNDDGYPEPRFPSLEEQKAMIKLARVIANSSQKTLTEVAESVFAKKAK